MIKINLFKSDSTPIKTYSLKQLWNDFISLTLKEHVTS